MSSSVSSRPWEADYVDLTSEFLSDEVIDYLEKKIPRFEDVVKHGCPTCEVPGSGCKKELQLYKHYLNAGIGLTYQKLSWDDYRGDPAALDITTLYLTKHREMVRGGLGILYHGSFGTGKTFLSTMVAKELVKLGYSVYFATFTQMVDEFTRGWGSNEEKARFESRVVKSDIFILDDVGKEFRTKTNLSEATFDHVLRQRALDSRPTFLTTNMTTEELSEGYGSAIFSLLKERMIVHHMVGDDFREFARERTFEEIKDGIKRGIV